MITPIAIAGYIALFLGLSGIFLLVNLLVSSRVRPNNPSREKGEIYECGEPTIGSSFVQFDIRFYVVALLFIIFDVEVAFFFPWATVFGKATNLADERVAVVQMVDNKQVVSKNAQNILLELGFTPEQAQQVPSSDQIKAFAAQSGISATDSNAASMTIRDSAKKLSLLSIYDILAFFAVLMVGFAYVWRRGDLDWVRALSNERAEAARKLPHQLGSAVLVRFWITSLLLVPSHHQNNARPLIRNEDALFLSRKKFNSESIHRCVVHRFSIH